MDYSARPQKDTPAKLTTDTYAASTKRRLWNQSESVAIYQNVGIVKHVPGGDFGFGLSSYLNNPEFIEVWNETAVQYTFSYGTGATYLLDTARHNLGVTQGSVDVFTAALGGSKDTTLFGFSSTQTNAAPAWELTLPGCSADNGVGGTYIGMEASDSGNALAFQCVYKDPTTGNYSARAYLVDGQGGNATWSFDVTAQYGVKAGQVRARRLLRSAIMLWRWSCAGMFGSFLLLTS